MINEIDSKGKVFTNIVHKEPVRVIIQTTANLIEGEIHIRPGTRLLDELKEQVPYIPLTNVKVKSLQGDSIYSSSFMVLNPAMIVWVIPLHEMQTK